MISLYVKVYRRFRDSRDQNGPFYTRYLPEVIFFFAVPQVIFFPVGVLLSSITGIRFFAILASFLLPLLLYFWGIHDRKK